MREVSGSSSKTSTINEEMVAAGLGKIARFRGRMPQGNPALMQALESAEDGAKESRVGMWEYGDVGDSDDEEDRPRGAWGRSR